MFKDYKIIINTMFPVAYDSADHMEPEGTKNDNSSNIDLIHEIEKDLSEISPLQILDLGCAGGGLVHDFVKKGHIAVGLEGSDYNIVHQRAEWPALYGKNLFTCDITKEYSIWIEKDQKISPFACDLITAWEVVEHIPPDRLSLFFELIRRHLKIGGRFIAGISLCSAPPHHASLFSISDWKKKILNHLPGFLLQEYPYHNTARSSFTSLYIALQRIA